MTEEPYVKARRADGKYTAVPKSQYEAMGPRMNTEAMLEWLTDEFDDLAKGGNETENRTILFQGKEIDVDDELGETSDMIHHPDHYTWKGTECKKVIELMTRGLSGAEAYYMGNIIKYLYRYPKKGTLGTDLAKAAQYMEFLKEYFEKKEESGHAE